MGKKGDFSQLLLQTAVTFESMTSDTQVLMTATLDPDDDNNDIRIGIKQLANGYDPCLIHVTCEFCLLAECGNVKDNFTENAVEFYNLTTYGTELEYHCSLGKEFDYGNGTILPTMATECQWDGNWTTTSLKPCVCKEITMIQQRLYNVNFLNLQGLLASILPFHQITQT